MSDSLPRSAYHLPPVAQDWRQSDWPEVSVSVVTYNQRHLIGRALDSILVQRVNFSYEIVVGDDGSTDGTLDVLQEYAERSSRPIRILRHDHLPGIPGRLNNMNNPMACRGKYTAYLDGDDYWIDPCKLQRQYDMMEAHPELSMCLHDTRGLEVDSEGVVRNGPHLRSDRSGYSRKTGFYNHEHFCLDRNIGVHTSSYFFRTRIFGDWPEGYENVVAADHYLFLLISQRGPIHYDSGIRSVNERQPASLTNSCHYNGIHRILQHFRDMDMYRRRFPATRITSSYSAYSARMAKDLLIYAVKHRKFQLLPKLCIRLVLELRGVGAMMNHRLRKSWH